MARRTSRWLAAGFVLLALLSAASSALAITARVKQHRGSPTLFVDGRPTAPLIFFGRPLHRTNYTFTLGREWKQYGFTFTAPEDNQGDLGVHIRVGGSGPGTVWIDDARVCPVDEPGTNMLRFGGWEGSRQEVARAWRLFASEDRYNSKAEWDITPDGAAEGERACRLRIISGGSNPMHCHFFQSGMSCRKGRRYRFTVKMKADREIRGDLQALHHGPPWTKYPREGSVYKSQVRKAAAAGVHIHSFITHMGWPRAGKEPDFSRIRTAIEDTLEADPDALLLPRFGMSAPAWWQKQHPDHCLTFDDGQKEGECPASELWRRQALKKLRAYVRFCEKHYGDRIIGYHPCGQHTGEWFYQRSWKPQLSGFSPAMEAGFRRWLKEKYKTDAALAKAWNDPNASLKTATVPSAEERRSTAHGLFRDPRAERKVLDFYRYKQLAMEQPLEQMARVIKEETDREKLVVFFYGYFFAMSGIPRGPQISGHLAMQEMLDCPDVDILCSPISYFDRQPGGCGPFMTAVDSVRAAGKLWLNEDDTRTYLTPEDTGHGRAGRADTPTKTKWVHRRNFGNILPRRMATWYMDLGGVGWLDGRDIWDNVQKLRSHYQQSLERPAGFDPEVAVIVSERSPYAVANNNTLMRPQCYIIRRRLYRLGAPIRVHYLGDLVDGEVPPCKAYIFLNPFHLDEQARTAIEKATDGKTAVYFYGSGFLGERADDRLITELTGIPVKRQQSGKPRSSFVEGDSPLLKGMGQEPFGTQRALSPLWTVPDAPGITPLATGPDGKTLVAAKTQNDGLRVYVGTTDAPAGFLRNVLKESGVHLYVDSDDIVNASEHLLSITASETGTKYISLPRRAKVSDIITGETIGKSINSFTLKMQAGETRLFELQ